MISIASRVFYPGQQAPENYSQIYIKFDNSKQRDSIIKIGEYPYLFITDLKIQVCHRKLRASIISEIKKISFMVDFIHCKNYQSYNLWL